MVVRRVVDDIGGNALAPDDRPTGELVVEILVDRAAVADLGRDLEWAAQIANGVVESQQVVKLAVIQPLTSEMDVSRFECEEIGKNPGLRNGGRWLIWDQRGKQRKDDGNRRCQTKTVKASAHRSLSRLQLQVTPQHRYRRPAMRLGKPGVTVRLTDNGL